jgi:hypothetical protein
MTSEKVAVKFIASHSELSHANDTWQRSVGKARRIEALTTVAVLRLIKKFISRSEISITHKDWSACAAIEKLAREIKKAPALMGKCRGFGEDKETTKREEHSLMQGDIHDE